jgi:queuine tRNA-ribosyltransferase
MHSRTPPEEEAQRLYVEQSNLAERVRPSADGNAEPLVIWDVGLGAAANAMAAIRCYEAQAANGPVRPLRIISFENDLDSLRLAFQHTDKFTYLRHSGPAGIIHDGAWQSRQFAGLSWMVMSGDFLETMGAAPAPPDLIFYDMYSQKTSGPLWTVEAFRRLFAACAGRAAELFTYTCSTATRTALLAAGFCVAKGRSAGKKVETTIALTPEAFREPASCRHELLTADWLEKWHRSAAKFPAGVPTEQRPLFEQAIREHEQFRQFSLESCNAAASSRQIRSEADQHPIHHPL